MTIIYLYVKTHRKTGLKYLGKTKRKNPHSYRGSGKYWSRHCMKHGWDYETIIVRECKTNDEVKLWGIYYSDLWNVVNDKSWANLAPERGDGGWNLTPEHRKKNGEKIKGHPNWNLSHTENSKLKISKRMREKLSKLSNDEKSLRTKNSWSSPVSWTDKRKQKISKALTGIKRSLETKKKISKKCIFVSPDGQEYKFDGLKMGCETLNLNYKSVKNCVHHSGCYKHWKIKYE